MERKKKYTHIIETTNGFLKAGVRCRLKLHGYSMSEAYWRLRQGKGLVSAYDKETFELWSNMITQLRRFMGSPIKLSPGEHIKLQKVKEEVLEKMEIYRSTIETGVVPVYLTTNYRGGAVRRVLMRNLGGYEEFIKLNENDYDDFWNLMPTTGFFEDLAEENDKLEKELIIYNELPEHVKRYVDEPGYETVFIFDKFWQIRTNFEFRCSKGAEINKTLLYIWDIPSQTDESHRQICQENLDLIEIWKSFKLVVKKNKFNYKKEDVYQTIIATLSHLKTPNI